MSRRPLTSSRIIPGDVLHVRHTAPARRFRHRTCSYVLDIDELQNLPRRFAWLLGVDARRPLALRTSTHLPDDAGKTLRARIESCLARHGRPPATGPVLLVANLAVLGYVFDPVSWWCCYDDDGSLHTVVAEVHNTFGECHTYAIPATADDGTRAGSDGVRKSLHVSPFLPMDLTYDLHAVAPSLDGPDGQRVSFSVTVRSGDNALRFVGAQRGRCRAFTLRRLLWAQIRFPLAPQVVVARIHLHALRLWLRRARLHRKPPFTPHTGSCAHHEEHAA